MLILTISMLVYNHFLCSCTIAQKWSKHFDLSNFHKFKAYRPRTKFVIKHNCLCACIEEIASFPTVYKLLIFLRNLKSHFTFKNPMVFYCIVTQAQAS